jgi:hypothetical protein
VPLKVEGKLDIKFCKFDSDDLVSKKNFRYSSQCFRKINLLFNPNPKPRPELEIIIKPRTVVTIILINFRFLRTLSFIA